LRPQPVVEWLAHVPTNTAVSNIVIQAGPYLDRDTGHYYYLLGATNWTTSEFWATQLGGHLVTVNTANEQNWVFDNFANYGGVNRNLWIGLTNGAAKFKWASGQTNVAYTNWLAGQPLNTDGTRNYAFIRGNTNLPSGLWVLARNNGVVQGSPATNLVYGVVEVEQIQTNGVQLWVSATNSMPGGSNLLINGYGALYANIVDTNFVSHEIYSAPLLLQSNVFQHIALTYNTNSGIAALYLNGTNVAVTNLGVFIPKTDGDVLLGHDMTLYTNNYFGGQMDEMSIYRRALSGAEIAAIYQVSAGSTNRLLGKFDPAVTPAYGLAEALVSFGSTTNVIFGINNQWEVNSFTFTATSNSMPLTISGLQPGILLDSFAVSEAPLTNLYYFPEQSLEAFTGNSAYGLWTLQIWDNRVGAYVTNANQLVNWQLSFVLDTNSLFAGSLAPQTPGSGTVAAGQTIYYSVTVPSWANVATNVLLSSTLPVDVFYFSPTNAPTGANPADWTLLTNVVSGIGAPILITNGVPPAQLLLLPGQTYYLGVRNPGNRSASISLEVDYDITGLTNGVPYAATLTTNDALRYFSFNVSSNAYEATFQLLKLSSNADLVVRKGVPLPWLTNADYGSFNVSNLDESIFVLTNSSPVPLSAGTWYLGVVRRSSGPVDYTVLAKELDALPPTIIELTNGVPVNFTAGPGAAHTNFFHFAVTNMVVNGVTNQGLRFELYNLTGNGDLTVQTNALPLSPPFFQLSQNSGLSSEMILLHTNSALTNLTADWYLGVPNNEATNISFTILAVFETNAYFPAFPGAGGAGGGAVGAGHAGVVSSVYHVTTTADSGPGSLRSAVSGNNRTVVFDVSGTIGLWSPLIITNSYLTIAGQTAPGGGISVMGNMTTVQSAHDVVIRGVRFRTGVSSASQTSSFDGVNAGDYLSGQTVGAWAVLGNQVSLVTDAANAYSGSNLLALANGVIGTTLPTVAGASYALTFAYRGPGLAGFWRAETNTSDSINGNDASNVQNITFGAGEVGQAFQFDGSTSLITVPASPSLAVSNVTVEAWIYPTDLNTLRPIIEWGGAGQYGAISLWLNTQNGLALNPGGLHAIIRGQVPTATPFLEVDTTSQPVPLNKWSHVAFAANLTAGRGVIYYNGVPVITNTTAGVGLVVPTSLQPVNFGYRNSASLDTLGGRRFKGSLDEVSIYNRTLSPSEIKAIYTNAAAGKFDTAVFKTSPAQSLAEAQISVGGQSAVTIQGSNTTWQLKTIQFTATQNGTLLQFSGIEPGMLLGSLSLISIVNPDDSLKFVNTSNVMVDHISATWSTNRDLAVMDSTNVTVQWAIMADSLYKSNNPTSLGSFMNGGAGLSFHHNLYADNYAGSPRVGDNVSLDFVNNVIYNWGLFSGLSGTNNFTNQLNYACNYLIAGPDTARFATNLAITNIAFIGGTPNTWIFQTNNYMDSNTNRILDGGNTQWGMFTNQYIGFNRPFPVVPVPTDEAFIAYERVLDFAGVNLSQRDAVDASIVAKVRNQTGRLISTPASSWDLVAWWKAEGNCMDSANTNNGTKHGALAYASGEVGQAFVFNHTDSYITFPSSSSLDIGASGSGFTIEAWIKPDAYHITVMGAPIIEWDSATTDGLQFWSGGGLFANLKDISGVAHNVQTTAIQLSTNNWQHVAVTYDKVSGAALIYLNGAVVASQTFVGLTPQTTYPVNIGRRTGQPIGLNDTYGGSIDELSLFKRALSASEIQAIYNAGSAGKFAQTVVPAYLDTDQDGIPDFWEITFGTNPYLHSNNNDRDGDGYTDLEEYNNWLAETH
ncbi:MAG: LamG-like jellyroll fold domain-containing protein, partial [Verrucomicrobiota bacterium]